MAILTNSGRVVMAESVKVRAIHLAWGTGLPDWDVTPVSETTNEVTLVAEIGRRKVTAVKYCTPDVNGEIVAPTGKFAESLVPTRHLYMRFNFDFADAPAASIREVAVFVGTETDPLLPIGQMYFEPAHVIAPGLLLLIERTEKFVRSLSVRQSFEFVATF